MPPNGQLPISCTAQRVHGRGQPLLSLHHVVYLALSYAQATASRDPLIKHAALALTRLQHPVCETVDLQQRLHPLGVRGGPCTARYFLD